MNQTESNAKSPEAASGSLMRFERRSLVEDVKRLWPPYRRAQDAKTREAIRWLLDHPEQPCVIGGEYIPHGYGRALGLMESLIGTPPAASEN